MSVLTRSPRHKKISYPLSAPCCNGDVIYKPCRLTTHTGTMTEWSLSPPDCVWRNHGRFECCRALSPPERSPFLPAQVGERSFTGLHATPTAGADQLADR